MRRFVSGQVSVVERLGPQLHRVELSGPKLRGLSWAPGQSVQLLVGLGRRIGPRMPGPLRTYSVAGYAGDTLQLYVLDRGGDAPGETWARTVRAGRPAQFLTPHGDFVLKTAPYYVFAGDETAAAAFAPMIAALPAGTPHFTVIEVDTADSELPVPGVTWLHRNGAPAASSQPLAEAVAALPLPAGPGLAYVAGEARTIQLVRSRLVDDHGWSRRDVITKPFWTPGKRGLD